MNLKGKKVGFVVTGSHCTLEQIMIPVKEFVDSGAEVTPVITETVQTSDTRFGEAKAWRSKLMKLTGKKPIESIVDAEPIGPKKLFDIVVVMPCTGNTMAKLVNGITDTTALMAIKAQLRNQRPVVIGVSTNDGLSMNAKNLGLLLNMKNIYLIPFGQDDFISKANSLVAKVDLTIPTTIAALKGEQIQPLLIEYPRP